jgi:hypothetical protein
MLSQRSPCLALNCGCQSYLCHLYQGEKLDLLRLSQLCFNDITLCDDDVSLLHTKSFRDVDCSREKASIIVNLMPI